MMEASPMNLRKKMAALCAEEGISLQEAADQLGVSLKTVQEWEMDEEPAPLPTQVFEEPVYHLRTELLQATEEGKDIAPYNDLFLAAVQMPDSPFKARIADTLYDLSASLPKRADFAYQEPSKLENIRALRPEKQPEKKALPKQDTLEEKILAAWQGRVSGCLLGKIIEGIRTNELHPFLKKTDNFPMHRYILSTDLTEENTKGYAFRFRTQDSLADLIDHAPVDDDTNYVVMGQVMIEKYGRDFTAANVGQTWLDYQPRRAYFTAERVAFNNMVNGFLPPHSARFQNPFREWIGAQIRGDYYGYINPGDPETAADMAWRDASVSHIKNGIYGEMFVAAMLAQTAVEDDIEKILEAGLSQIPETSRLYAAIIQVIKDYHAGVSYEECWQKISAAYNEHTLHGWCHTISNAMIVAAGLLYGGGDFGKSICLAVQSGFDTDCNGATVGSIMGMRNGTKGIDPYWTSPVHDELETSIFGVGRVKISQMAKKTMEHMKK